ncbi:hypothetical protein Taro_031729 [Colocasia esculenta]|uniref:Uncharacterized protein n=1 Tax=Colocasia esculenta TaxID=4460 RepID=A0A843W3Y8_COLES|nr:hypothetical protein [Colocasia esculenta]
MQSSSMRLKMIPRRQTPKASGEAAPPALPAKRTEEEDSAPSSLSSSNDGAKCQKHVKHIYRIISNFIWHGLLICDVNGIRVANELGAGNAKAARFATLISMMTSLMIGIFFFVSILVAKDKVALIFSTSSDVLVAVGKLSTLLAFTILLNSVQPILSGVAVGSGWQSTVAYINIGSYYVIGLPFGILLGWRFNLGILGVWAGLICGTVIQTLTLAIIVLRFNWDNEVKKAIERVNKFST